jgi:hypothetical protein
MTGLDLVPTSKFIVFQRASLLVGGRGCHPRERVLPELVVDERPGMIPIDQSCGGRLAPSIQERTIIQSSDGSRKDRLKKGEEFSVDEPLSCAGDAG